MGLGDKFKLIRQTNGLNQKTFAERIGISQGTLSDIERGICQPSCDTLKALHVVFKCDLNWLLEDDSEMNPSSETFATQISPMEAKLLNILRSIHPEDQAELIEIAEIKHRKKRISENR